MMVTTFAAYVECPMKVAVRHVKCPEMTALSVERFIYHSYAPLTMACLVWGECSHVFHMHCLLKWIGTSASKQQCPMDRRTWGISYFIAVVSTFSDLCAF